MLKSEPKKIEKESLTPFLVPGVIIALVAISSLFLVGPQIGKIFQVRRQLKQEEERLARLTTKAVALGSLNQADVSQRANLVTRAYLSEKNFPLLISTFKSLANKNNLNLLSLQVDPGEIATASAKVKKGEAPSLSFNLTISGRMDDFKQFLDQASQAAPLMMVQEISVKGQAIVQGNFDGDLVLAVPFSFPLEQLPPVEKPLAQVNQQEEEIYARLTQLNMSFVLEEAPFAAVPGGKENPFKF